MDQKEGKKKKMYAICKDRYAEMKKTCKHHLGRERNPPKNGYYHFDCEELKLVRKEGKDKVCSLSGKLVQKCVDAYDKAAKACRIPL